jgi:hypothetical protein
MLRKVISVSFSSKAVTDMLQIAAQLPHGRVCWLMGCCWTSEPGRSCITMIVGRTFTEMVNMSLI